MLMPTIVEYFQVLAVTSGTRNLSFADRPKTPYLTATCTVKVVQFLVVKSKFRKCKDLLRFLISIYGDSQMLLVQLMGRIAFIEAQLEILGKISP